MIIGTTGHGNTNRLDSLCLYIFSRRREARRYAVTLGCREPTGKPHAATSDCHGSGYDDWMICQSEDVVIHRATVTKFGIQVGEVTLFFTQSNPDGGSS
ncbi:MULTISPECIES: DUF3833 family protein [Chromohalobacter]|uniref:DUF3833 family protein n=1 Tax=Chromohalobacter beijerinckii TaxID=86179 RepID=A0ABV8XIN6_9GAMM